MSDTSYNGREIPTAWQIEFEPFDDRLKTAIEKIKASGVEPDGDGWSEIIEKQFTRQHPKLAKEFHSDSESSSCVVWVESEDACRKLIEVVWSLMHPAAGRGPRGAGDGNVDCGTGDARVRRPQPSLRLV